MMVKQFKELKEYSQRILQSASEQDLSNVSTLCEQGEYSITVGKKNLAEGIENNTREHENWKGAIKELQDNGLIISTGNHFLFNVSDDGFNAFDKKDIDTQKRRTAVY